MGQIWRNRTLYSGVNQSRLMMTQAEYDQLPSSEKNDGQFRVITDAPSVIDLIYPVGSVYISINNVNPGTYLTGTAWEAFGTGQTLVGVDTTQTEFNTVQKTGGEKTHKLTVTEMPSHTHRLEKRQQWYSNDTVISTSTGSIYSWKAGEGTGGSTSKSYQCTYDDVLANGGSQSHNNLQPYITVYMWKRTH